MRNTFVHRGRRTNFWAGSADPGKPGDFSLSLRLPVSPDLTEVEAVVQAAGIMAATFEAPAAELLDAVTKSVGAYVAEACRALTKLWRDRRADPSLIPQSPGSGSNPRD